MSTQDLPSLYIDTDVCLLCNQNVSYQMNGLSRNVVSAVTDPAQRFVIFVRALSLDRLQVLWRFQWNPISGGDPRGRIRTRVIVLEILRDGVVFGVSGHDCNARFRQMSRRGWNLSSFCIFVRMLFSGNK